MALNTSLFLGIRNNCNKTNPSPGDVSKPGDGHIFHIVIALFLLCSSLCINLAIGL